LADLHPIEHLRYVARSGGVPAAMLVEETAEAVLGLSSRFGHVDSAELLVACRRILSRRPVSGPLWWMAGRVVTAADVRREVAELLRELAADRTAVELEAALPHGATVTVVGWSIQAAQGLLRRGDVSVLALDALGEGAELARQLGLRGIVATRVAPEAVAAAVAASDAVLVEASIAGPGEALCVTGSVPAAAVARHLGVPVWLVAGVGYRVPQALYAAAIGRWQAEHDARVEPGARGEPETADVGPDPTEPRLRDEERLDVALVDSVLCEAGLLAAPPIPTTPNFPRVPELEHLGVVLADRDL
jgi:hypothetical protein